MRCAVDRAAAEARLLRDLGVDGFLIENAFDRPAIREDQMGPEVPAHLTRLASVVKRQVGRAPVGIRVVEDASRVALAVAQASGCQFIQVDVPFNGSSRVGEVLRYRKQVGAESVLLVADLRPHSVEEVEPLLSVAEESCVNAAVLLGSQVGEQPEPEIVSEAARLAGLPLFIGDGLCAETLPDYLDLGDGFVTGSGLKEGRYWRAPICEKSVRSLIGELEYVRGQEVISQ